MENKKNIDALNSALANYLTELSNIITKAFNLLSYELRDMEVSVFDKVLDEKADEMKKFINRYIGQYIEWQKVAMRMLKGDDDQWKPK